MLASVCLNSNICVRDRLKVDAVHEALLLRLVHFVCLAGDRKKGPRGAGD